MVRFIYIIGLYVLPTVLAVFLYRWVYFKVSTYMARWDDELTAIADEEDKYKLNPFADWDTDEDWTDYKKSQNPSVVDRPNK